MDFVAKRSCSDIAKHSRAFIQKNFNCTQPLGSMSATCFQPLEVKYSMYSARLLLRVGADIFTKKVKWLHKKAPLL